MTRVIIFREKHGDLIFDASTPELVGKAMVKVISDRLNDDYWYENDYTLQGRSVDTGEQPDLFKKKVLSVKEVAQKVIELSTTEPEKAYVLAKTFMGCRQRHQYEGYDIVTVESV
jgi:hypothetical protein